ACLLSRAWWLEKAAQARRGPQLERLSALASRNLNGLTKTAFRVRCLGTAAHQEQLAFEPTQLGFVEAGRRLSRLLETFGDRPEGLFDAAGGAIGIGEGRPAVREFECGSGASTHLHAAQDEPDAIVTLPVLGNRPPSLDHAAAQKEGIRLLRRQPDVGLGVGLGACRLATEVTNGGGGRLPAVL